MNWKDSRSRTHTHLWAMSELDWRCSIRLCFLLYRYLRNRQYGRLSRNPQSRPTQQTYVLVVHLMAVEGTTKWTPQERRIYRSQTRNRRSATYLCSARSCHRKVTASTNPPLTPVLASASRWQTEGVGLRRANRRRRGRRAM